jgi:hypothetical protein
MGVAIGYNSFSESKKVSGGLWTVFLLAENADTPESFDLSIHLTLKILFITWEDDLARASEGRQRATR